MNFDQRYFELSNQDPYVQSVKRQGGVLVKKMPYQYGAVVGSAARPLTLANGAITQPLTTLNDSDFAVTSLAVGVNISANADMKFNRNLTIQIQDTATGKFWFSLPVVTSLVAGGGGFPFIFVANRIIRPNSTILITAQNRDTAQDYFQMFVTLGGSRFFYQG